MFNSRRSARVEYNCLILPLAAALAVFASLFIPAQAAGEPWTIVSVGGDARLIVGAGAARQPEPGQPVTGGVAIATGANGRVVMARRGDSITVMPNSRMSVPAGVGGGEPGVLQSLGKLLFRMESRDSRDFQVTTPYLAAAIKGTTFTVDVRDDASSVEVSEGVVQVTALASGDVFLVGAGERAEVDRDGSESVQADETRERRDANSSERRGTSFSDGKTGGKSVSSGEGDDDTPSPGESDRDD